MRALSVGTQLCGSLLLLLSLFGCGKEAGRIPFRGEDSREVTMQLEAGDVAFWSDLDLAYEGDPALAYAIELQQGSTVGRVACDPLGTMTVKIGWVETQFGSSHSLSGSGKMLCRARVAKSGATRVRATLAFSTPPTSCTFKKADLVIKQ